MTTKSRRERKQASKQDDRQMRWSGRLKMVVLGGAVAFVVCGTLIPSEAAISEGIYAPVAAGWCVLLVMWGIAVWLDARMTLRLGWTEVAGAALVGWHSLAALVALGSTNGRHALNAQWLIISYGLAVFLLRQVLQTAAQARALVVGMIWLATLLASFGFYQYFYSMPQLRRQYQANPEQALIDNGIPTDKHSPQRELFENRLRSVEPLATFALTNSLAGFLAPWLIAALAVGLAALFDRGQRRTVIAAALAAIAIGGCLLLTKSRSAYLSVFGGVLLLALYGPRSATAWRPDWRIPAVAAGMAVVLSLVAFVSGGLDVQVLSEAPKSVLYRVEYWQATSAIIADFPLFGCGPGNFQETYAAYKLPQASETVGDPHNFLLEMWATAGTPALVLLLLLMIAVAVDIALAARTQRPSLRSDALRDSSDNGETRPAQRTVLGGALAGLLLAAPLGAMVGYPLDAAMASIRLPVVWLLGVPLMAAFWWLMKPWISRGYLSLSGTVVPQLVLLVNLLAAGAIVFPGVIGTLLVLIPAALCLVRLAPADTASPVEVKQDRFAPALPVSFPLSQRAAGLILFAAVILTLACTWTAYQPVLQSRSRFAEALDALRNADPVEAETAAVEAAEADPLWPEPWRLLAEIRLQRWLITNREDDWKSFETSASTFFRLNPRHHAAWFTRGNWYLAAWRKRGLHEDLDEAIAAYRRASVCYPSRAFYHAQLAWALHLSGDKKHAFEEADKAKRLDELMPHREQKLSRQRVFDPQLTAERDASASAELIVERLRTTDGEDLP